jgi:Lrp/AsnC family transcriptional regulator, leucine-responsive regulatory protein
MPKDPTVATDLEDLDRRLLHRLAEQARPDFSLVANDIGTSPEDAQRRFERLVDAGVIRECVARLDPGSVGVGFTAFLMVRLAQNAENYPVVRQMLGDLESVEAAHAVSGDYDWLLKVRAASLSEVQALVTQHLSLLPGFLRAQTCVVLDTACDWVNADRVRLVGA